MLDKAKTWVEKSISHLQVEFSQLQLGRANPALLDSVRIDNYGSMQPLSNVASVSSLDAQTLMVKPWDKQMIHGIAKAITDANVWLNPQTMADGVMIKIPPMTEERRRDIAKIVKRLWDEAKVWVRNARWDSQKAISNALADKTISENEADNYKKELQKLVDDANSKIDEMVKKKSEDVLKI